MTDLITAILSSVPWPLPVRPDLASLAEPEVRQTVATALVELGFAVLLLTIALVVRRGRFVAVLAALPLIVMQGPRLSLMLVEATPASYHPSPTGFTPAAIAAGRRVFAENCVPCHGPNGDGAGGLGAVANLRQPHIWSHTAGDLYWFVSHGIAAEDDHPAMPAFEPSLPEIVRWSLIDYVHALSAGAVAHGLEDWPEAVPAPPLALSCASIAARGTADLRGKVIRVILGVPPVPLDAVPPVNGIAVVTVWIAGGGPPGAPSEPAPEAGIDCVARGGADAATAYAILAGAADGHLIPARFLIDPDGVLRSVWREDDGDAWSDPDRLLAEIQTICTESPTVGSGGEHEHHH